MNCRVFGKTTRAGCGQHIDEFLRTVPDEDRCPGRETEPRTGFFGRIFGR